MEKTSKNICEVAALAALVVLIAGCGGGRTPAPRADVAGRPAGTAPSGNDSTLSRAGATAAAGETTTTGTGSARDTTFVRGGAGGGGTAGSSGIPGRAAPADSAARALPEPVLDSANLIMGYRIQIFTSASLVEAESLRDRLRRDGVPAYVEYRSPLYRVRLWDCTDLAEARLLRERAVLMGYERATVVPTLVQADRVSKNEARAF